MDLGPQSCSATRSSLSDSCSRALYVDKTWSFVGSTGTTSFLAPQWQKIVAENIPLLSKLRLATLPEMSASEVLVLESRLVLHPKPAVDTTARLLRGRWFLGAALATALIRRGWAAESPPGEPVRLRHDTHVVEPFDELDALFHARLSHEEWRRRWEGRGVADFDLAG